jgi:hypothetical protein
MVQLRVRESDDDDGLCAECRREPAVGPCAACHAMVCGDCCSLVTDPGGKRVICLSCARLVADVNRKPVRRRPPSAVGTAVIILVVFAVGLLAALLHR